MAHDIAADTGERLLDLGHLSGGIGHHVINAFSAVVSNAEILRLTAGTPAAVDPVQVADTIIRTAVDAAAVARRLIDFTRPVTAIGEATVSLEQVVEGVIAEGRARELPGVSWEAQAMTVPRIKGDAEQLRSMLGHLILNSLEAMPESGGSITISTALDDRGWVCLEVRDTASGMSAESQSRAVEPFYTTKPGRFGVGLSIANGIWRRHRGTLAVRSTPGEGTLVRLCVDPGGDRPSYMPR